MGFWKSLFNPDAIRVTVHEVNSKPPMTAEEYYAHRNSQDAPSVDDFVKDAVPSKGGLYPHEILVLSYINQPRIKYITPDSTEFPSFWLYKYGVEDMPALMKSLHDRGFLDSDYKLTAKGQKEVNDNGYVYYIHRFSKDLNMTPWHFNKLEVPERIKDYSWKDKYWWWLNQRGGRNDVFAMAEFRAYEGNYAHAVELIDRVMAMDRRSGDFREFPDGTPPGIRKLKDKWAKKIK